MEAWKLIAKKLEPFQYTVWTEFSPLAIKYNAINLGQGFPAFKCPDFAKQALIDATNSDENQYSRSQGYLPLCQELARFYSSKYNREINPLAEIAVTIGASEGIMCALLGMVNPEDEVVMIEPCFDLYIPQTAIFGGIPVGVL
ncbi:unnamed protein product [Blepharisma stoltei]|uniref:Aminotransferase class I/classII large domain-containing protein n=1 Tax=Blepharisma stoltei TaxID=1481888 RepID=A0AAU9JXG9_9CILI|nr:unnamed protein product [Blepharisma stoltei]